MQIIDRPTDRKILNAMMPNYFGDMVKAVVDIAQKKIGVDAELHADIEQALLAQGSSQYDLWGVMDKINGFFEDLFSNGQN